MSDELWEKLAAMQGMATIGSLAKLAGIFAYGMPPPRPVPWRKKNRNGGLQRVQNCRLVQKFVREPWGDRLLKASDLADLAVQCEVRKMRTHMKF